MTRTAGAGAQEDGADGKSSASIYLQLSELPLFSLVFLLPFIVYYEVGTRYLTTAAQHGRDQQIIAFTLIRQFFHLFGAGSRHLPALAVAGILLSWHIARNDAWRIDPKVLMVMFFESILLAVPLLTLSFWMSRYFPLAATNRGANDFVIMSMGAGIYEELIFRLGLFCLLSLVLKDTLRIGSPYVYLLVVCISGISFSAYHYLSPSEHFQLRTFAFRALAGIYFGALFLLRGFGITAGSHTAYDILIMFF